MLEPIEHVESADLATRIPAHDAMAFRTSTDRSHHLGGSRQRSVQKCRSKQDMLSGAKQAKMVIRALS